MAWNLSGYDRNPYAQGGSRWSPTSQYWGWQPAAGANYDPSMQGFDALGYFGDDNSAYLRSGTQGLAMPFDAGQANGPAPYRNPYGNPLADMLKQIQGMDFGGSGGGGGQRGRRPAGDFTYNTGISGQPAITSDQQAAQAARLRETPGGGPALGTPLTASQDATIRRQQQDFARMEGMRGANAYNQAVNTGESALQFAQDQAKSQVGQQSQQFANRLQAHKFNQASARRNAGLGMLGNLMSMFGNLG